MWSKARGYWTYTASTSDTVEIRTEKPKRKPRKKKAGA
jgi:hypothetical protein